jgi:hypothetical protein
MADSGESSQPLPATNSGDSSPPPPATNSSDSSPLSAAVTDDAHHDNNNAPDVATAVAALDFYARFYSCRQCWASKSRGL